MEKAYKPRGLFLEYSYFKEEQKFIKSNISDESVVAYEIENEESSILGIRYANDSFVFTLVDKKIYCERIFDIENMDFYEENGAFYASIEFEDFTTILLKLDLVELYKLILSGKFKTLEIPRLKTPAEYVEEKKQQITEYSHSIKQIKDYREELYKCLDCCESAYSKAFKLKDVKEVLEKQYLEHIDIVSKKVGILEEEIKNLKQLS